MVERSMALMAGAGATFEIVFPRVLLLSQAFAGRI